MLNAITSTAVSFFSSEVTERRDDLLFGYFRLIEDGSTGGAIINDLILVNAGYASLSTIANETSFPLVISPGFLGDSVGEFTETGRTSMPIYSKTSLVFPSLSSAHFSLPAGETDFS